MTAAVRPRLLTPPMAAVAMLGLTLALAIGAAVLFRSADAAGSVLAAGPVLTLAAVIFTDRRRRREVNTLGWLL